VQDREHEPEVDRDRCLSREQALDALLDRQVVAVDVVVEGDHLVGQLGISALERQEDRAQRAEHEVALGLKLALELCELLVEADAHLSQSDP